MQVIGVSGQHSNGKDQLADYLKVKLADDFGGPVVRASRLNEWNRASFAAAVKKCFCDYFGKDLAFIEEWKRRDEVPPGMIVTVRKALQMIGDGFRQIAPNVWIDHCFRVSVEPFIISDSRYHNEARAVRRNGGMNVLIWRKGWENDDPNPSEAQLRPLIDYCVRNCRASCLLQETGGVWELPFPDGFELYDVFVRSEGTLADLYAQADALIVPFVRRKFAA